MNAFKFENLKQRSPKKFRRKVGVKRRHFIRFVRLVKACLEEERWRHPLKNLGTPYLIQLTIAITPDKLTHF